MVGHTRATPGFFVGSIWPWFYTGISPLRHGIHTLVQLNENSYEIVCIPPGSRSSKSRSGNYLSRARQRVAVLVGPLSGISEKLNHE
jgi:hypothetical protein